MARSTQTDRLTPRRHAADLALSHLRAMEWADPDWQQNCPYCGHPRNPDGLHRTDCQLAHAINVLACADESCVPG